MGLVWFVLDLFRKWVLDFMGLFTQFCGHWRKDCIRHHQGQIKSFLSFKSGRIHVIKLFIILSYNWLNKDVWTRKVKMVYSVFPPEMILVIESWISMSIRTHAWGNLVLFCTQLKTLGNYKSQSFPWLC